MATVAGTAGNDVLVGTSGADIIYGYDGDDLIDGGLGADQIYGGGGNDRILFTSVQVSFPSPTTIGLIDGGEGFDVIDATSVRPTILGTIQNSFGAYVAGLFVGSQRYEIRNIDAIYLGAGDDSFSTPAGSPGIVDTGAGNDVGTANGPVQLYLGSGNDRVFITGSFGGPAISGLMDGGTGVDTLQFGNAFTVDLEAGTAKAGTTTYTITGFERYQLYANSGSGTRFYGNGGSESVTVNSLFNDGSAGVFYDGRGGDDRITGSYGDDTLIGGEGNDYLDGSSGNDRISGGFGKNVVVGGEGIDTVIFSARMDDATWIHMDGKTYVMMPHEITEISGVEILQFADGKTISVNALATEVREFNPLEYVASYPDLIAYLGTDAAAATAHYMDYGYAEGRSVSFSGLNYIASYTDLIFLFGTDTNNALSHFINYGFAEGRTASFDPLAYVASYPDLISFVGNDTQAAAQHFISYGFAEGRTVSFNALAYVASYADLMGFIGTDAKAAALHYVDHGYAEGRSASFNALAYVASYPDLIGGIGTNEEAALTHYINYGFAEGRTVSFDAAAYIASYSDLSAWLGNDTQGALRHYIQYGFAEGRSDHPVVAAQFYISDTSMEVFHFPSANDIPVAEFEGFENLQSGEYSVEAPRPDHFEKEFSLFIHDNVGYGFEKIYFHTNDFDNPTDVNGDHYYQHLMIGELSIF